MAQKKYDSTEEWRAVPGLDGRYEVSSSGRVRSLRHRGREFDRPRLAPKLLTSTRATNGYVRVQISGRPTSLHRLVLEAFTGPCPDGMQAAHLDGDRSNNHIHNLQWKTPIENCVDRDVHGTVARGERNGVAKLNDGIVREARRRYLAGETSKALAAEYGIAASAMHDAIRGKRWKHVED